MSGKFHAMELEEVICEARELVEKAIAEFNSFKDYGEFKHLDRAENLMMLAADMLTPVEVAS